MMNDEATPTQGALDESAESRIEEALFGKPDVEEEAVETAPEEGNLEGDPEETQEEVEEPEEGESEEVEWDVDSVLGTDPGQAFVNDEGKLVFNTVIDGEKSQVTAKDLIKSYQLEGHVNRKSMELSEQRKQFEAESAEQLQKYSEKIERAEIVTKILYQEATNSISEEELNHLKQTDPTAYLYKRQEMIDANEKFGKIINALEEEKANQQKQQLEQNQAQFHKFMEEQHAEILKNIPEWNDPDKAKSDAAAIKSFLKDSYGFNDQEIGSIYDHRLLRVIRDAQNFHNASKNVQKAKVKKVPKFQKPGSGRDESLANARKVKAQKAALRKSGSQRDLVNILIDRM